MLCGVRGSDWWWLVIGRGDEVMMMRWVGECGRWLVMHW